ncbi:Zinc finger protein 79 [Eumeta japonica]|uniref:Zinc finger protein 79 n=1 Tax=Eumeta variegata TaxID=151549 RepID=A0A4C1WIS3_EUMVA|nr:Zinc finger protein 79 [Eumeta japonica]
MLLEVDVGEHEIRLVNKLTEQHVNKDKIPKMKVSVAAQVLAKGCGCNEVLAMRLERCEFTIGKNMKIEGDVLAKAHEVRPLTPTATTSANLSYACNQAENHDELSTVVIKIEYEDQVCFSAGDLDLERKHLRQDCLTDTPMDAVQEYDNIIKKEDEMCKVIKQELCIDATVLQRSAVPVEAYRPQQDDATSTSLDTIAVQLIPSTKVEEHNYEDSYEESNMSVYDFVVNKTHNVNEETLSERSCVPVEAKDKGQCMCSSNVVTECECKTKMSNIKLDTLTDGKIYECEYCGYLTNKKTRLITHVSIHMAKEPEKLSFKLRKRRRTAEKPYRCDRCEYTTSDRHYLKSHIRVHTDEKPYKCKECEFRTSYLSALKIHIRTHTGEKPYRCEQCEYSTSDKGNLKSHTRVHTDEKPYECKHCKYRTSYSTALKRHMRIHTGEKPYECKQCEYRTSYLTVLKDHMRIHTGEKPYSCEQCEYTTSDKSRLKRHMRMHSGKKPYRCNQCEFTTSDQMYLKSHIRVHNEEKRYACKYCKYRTSYSCALKRHMCKHTGERPYGCEQCDYKATHLTALKAHMRIHTDVKPYRCEHSSEKLLCEAWVLECERKKRHTCSSRNKDSRVCNKEDKGGVLIATLGELHAVGRV